MLFEMKIVITRGKKEADQKQRKTLNANESLPDYSTSPTQTATRISFLRPKEVWNHGRDAKPTIKSPDSTSEKESE